jgi:hypothetical protein
VPVSLLYSFSWLPPHGDSLILLPVAPKLTCTPGVIGGRYGSNLPIQIASVPGRSTPQLLWMPMPGLATGLDLGGRA